MDSGIITFRKNTRDQFGNSQVQVLTKLWIILGDLNQLSLLLKNKSINSGNSKRYDNLNNFIINNNVIDFDFNGNPYSWHKKREKRAVIFSRLDQALANYLWIKLYHSSCVEIGSHYAPILIETQTRINQYNRGSLKQKRNGFLIKISCLVCLYQGIVCLSAYKKNKYSLKK